MHIVRHHTQRTFIHMCLLAITALAFLLRIYHVDLPVLSDEAEFGYSAYSVMKTGTNQYNQNNRLLFTVPGGDKYPALYSYTTIPFIKLFGLNALSERMPSIIFGTASCVVLFFLVVQLFGSPQTGLVSALLMAINPWSLYYSRQGRFEMIGIFLTLLGTIAFLSSIRTKKLSWGLLSALSFGLSLHANDASKIVTPLLIGGLIVMFRKALQVQKKRYLLVGTVFAIFFFLLLQVIFADQQIKDFTKQPLYQPSIVVARVNEQRRLTHAPLWISRIYHNKLTILVDDYTTSLLKPFSLNWFFQTGAGMMAESIGRFGQYLLFELPFFFIGIYLAFQKKIRGFFLLYWILIATIPGAITSGEFYAYRSILLLPIPLIFSGLGIVWFWNHLPIWFKHIQHITTYVRIAFVIGCALYTSSFLFSLYYDYPVYASEYRSEQRIDALLFARTVAHQYDTIFVSGRFEIAYAFINSIDPYLFQQAIKTPTTFQDVPTLHIGKYVFGSFPISTIATPSAYFSKRSLIIADGSQVLPSIKTIKTFTGPEPLRAAYVAFESK